MARIISSVEEQVVSVATTEISAVRKNVKLVVRGDDRIPSTPSKNESDNIPGIDNSSINYIQFTEVIKNGQVLYSENPADLAKFARVMMEINKRKPADINKVAIIGAGLGSMRRLIGKTNWNVTIFEPESVLVDFYNEAIAPVYPFINTTVVSGSVATNLTGHWDVIINTMPAGMVSRSVLVPRVAVSGILFDDRDILDENGESVQ